MLNAFMFTARVIILLLVCLIIIDLLYQCSHEDWIYRGNVAKKILIFLVRWLLVMISSILGWLWILGCYRNIDALFSVLRWAPCGSHKKHTRTHYAELVFLYSLPSAGHVVHSAAFRHEMSLHCFSSSGGPGAEPTKNTLWHIMPNLYFCIQCDLWVT
jgi:hypothetical protein